MALPRTVTLGIATAALALAPMTAATASSMPAYSVSVLHCGGGIAIKAFPKLSSAKSELNKEVQYQLRHPLSLRKIQLRHHSKVVASSKGLC